jgi:TolB-like protein/tetratricopeptide (TPR) repeat protein
LNSLAGGAGAGVRRFGDYELDGRTLELRKAGRRIKLAPQPARVLGLLASRPGELVTRDEIRRELWGEATFVDFERNLNYCLNCIRAVLCDTAQSPRYIETLPRRGYRFIAAAQRQRPFAEPTLAVLPFANLNGDPAQEYFADGITDALITELARIPAVRVISRQSVLHLKGSSRKLDEIARELGVDAVVEGSALHEVVRVRVTAQLILMEPERHAWAQSYDCDMSAVLTTQSEAARAIAACVATALRPARAAMPAPVPAGPKGAPVAPAIIEAYLRARTELQQGSAEGMGKALQHFREITAQAPDFAAGLAGYSACLFCLGWMGHAPTREVYPGAKQLASQAVAMDDSVSGAHQALATMHWLLDWDLPAAEREFRRAIELSPSDPDAHTFYAMFLSGAARHSESVAEAWYGLNLNPTSLFQNQAAAWVDLHAGRYPQAEAQARRTIGLFPDALQPHFVLGWAAWRLGSEEEAVAVFERAVGLSREALSLSFLGHVYARLGRRDEAEGFLRELDQLYTQGRASPIAFVVIHAGLGDADAAFGWLETVYRFRGDMVWLTMGFPGIDPLRRDPRFADLARRMGHPTGI